MTKQGVLPFRYECEPTASGMTALGGLPPYLELAVAERTKTCDSLTISSLPVSVGVR